MNKTIQDLGTGALLKIRAARAGDAPSPDDVQAGLDVLNELLDFWNTDDRAAYTVTFTDFTLVPGRSPHTIGPAGSKAGPSNPDFIVTERPVELKFASINLGNNVFRPLIVRDDRWYANQRVPAISSTVPTDVYYSDDWTDPNALGTGYGAVYFWGVPSAAYSVRLWLRGLLTQVALADQFSLPQGYYHALKLTLAEWIAEDFGQPVTPKLEAQAREARAAVFGTNLQIPRVRSRDVRLSGRRLGGGSFNYATRSFTR